MTNLFEEMRITERKENPRKCLEDGCKNMVDDQDYPICKDHREDGRLIIYMEGGIINDVVRPKGLERLKVTVMDYDKHSDELEETGGFSMGGA